MKNMFKTLAAVALIALAASCSKDAAEAPAVVDETAKVSFTVEMPGNIASRAGEGEEATELFYAVYDSNTKDYLFDNLDDAETIAVGTPTTISLELVSDQTYDIAFWAQDPDANFTFDAETNKKIVRNVAPTANEDTYDGFIFVRKALLVKGAVSETIELKRPFAQLNIGLSAGQFEAAKKAGFTLHHTKVTFTTNNQLNIFGGENYGKADGSGDYGMTVANAQQMTVEGVLAVNSEDKPAKSFSAGSKNYEHAYVTYLLPALPTDACDVTIEFYNADESKKIEVPTFTNVPFQRNHRTNIVGDLLTDPAKFNVIIKPEFEDEPGNIVEAWDGKTTKEPAKDTEGNYVIAEPSELAWLADQVNGVSRAAGNTFAGQTFKMTADLDLRKHPWMPIGNSTTNFQGTFDGQGHVIRNLVVNMPGKSDAGLFGMTTNGEIKNLVIEDAKITGRLNVGVVAGTPYTSKYTNITLQGLIQVEGMAYVGGIGGKNCYANWDQITINAEEGSYVKANSVENGTAYRTYVGGVIGFMGEGGHKVSNVSSNINVEGSTCDIGGITGIAHYGNIFENITCSGNVTNLVADAVDVLEMGGIAGVWHNQDGQTVTITNATFEGELINTVGVENYYYGGLVGAPYSKTGKGKLVLNGQEYVAVMTQEDLAEAAKEQGATINVPAGTYTMPNVVDGVTIIAAEGTIFKGQSSISAQNVTIKNVEFVNPNGNVALTGSLNNATFENCFFNDTEAVRWAYGNGDVVFNDCVFGNENCVRGIHFDGGTGTVTFNRCKLYGFNAFGGSLGLVTFNNCEFPYNTRYNVVNMYNKYAYNNCSFNPEMHCDCAGNGVVADFNNCTYTDGKDITTLVRYDQDPATCTITFDGFNKKGKTYTISSAAALVKLSQTTIAGGEKVVLAADIDLAGVEFSGLKAFNPEPNNIFDGQGHTVSNWTNESGASDMGFIKGWVGTIKNVTIKNAHLKTGGRSAVLAATVYANIENCHVINSSIEDSYWACGIIAGLYNSGSVQNCSVSGSSVKSNGGTGAIVGVMNETGDKRGFYNCTVTNTTVNNTGAYGEDYCGALICGMINCNATVTFEGCSYEGNTKAGQYVGDLYYGNPSNVIVK